MADDLIIIGPVGATPHGAVFHARSRTTGKAVALKLLRDPSPVDRQRFAQEAAVLARLSHPAIVPLVGSGVMPTGEPYLAMAWIEGPTLRERLNAGPLPAADTAALVRRIASGLGAAHALGVVHRDVKPSNIVLPNDRTEDAVLIDFGIARRADAASGLTRTGVAIGSPGYMSPEQARADKQIDPRSDVFALGCVAYTCLTGAAPFGAEHVMATRLRVLVSAPAPLASLAPDAPADLVALIDAMLAKRPEARPADGAAVVAALDAGSAAPAASAASGLAGSVVVLAGPDEDGALDLATQLGLGGLGPITLADGALVIAFGAQPDAAARAADLALAIRAKHPTLPIAVGQLPAATADAAPLDRLVAALAASQIRGALTGIAPVGVDAAVAAALGPPFIVELVDRLRTLRREEAP